jgi:hypothetical protein
MQSNPEGAFIMDTWRFSFGSSARLVLAAFVVAYAMMASAAPLLAANFTCQRAKEATVWPSMFTGAQFARIHVRCEPGDGPDGRIQYFAFPLLDPDSSRILSLATTAVAAKHQLFISYDDNPASGAQFGCLPENCRKILVFYLLDVPAPR